MVKSVSFITLSGKEYPIKMDILVMQKIQESYGSVKAFELLLMGWEETDGEIRRIGEPSLTVALWALPILIREGYAVNDMECDLTDAQIIREVDMNMYALADQIHEELKRAMLTKKVEPNQMIQNQIKTLTLMKRS